MPPRHADLFPQIADFAPLRLAARRAIKGKRQKPGAAAFMANFEREILRLERELRDGTYRPGRYVEILIRDPKERLVSAAPFRDRVVHHALCAVVQPIFEPCFIDNTYANRIGKGSHAAIAAYESYRNAHAHVLRSDIYRYFPSIDHAILQVEFRHRISCMQTLWLLDLIVAGSNRQEPVDLHFPGDDLFEPYRRRRGLPIGNLTSQFFANLYLNRFDHWVTEVLRADAGRHPTRQGKGAPYVRYVDDFALFHDDPGVLADWRHRIDRYLEGRRLRLHPRKTVVLPTNVPSCFLGFELHPDGHRLLPEDNVARFRGRLRGLRDRKRVGSVTQGEIDARVGSWRAHANHADTWRLQRAIFAGSAFEPTTDDH